MERGQRVAHWYDTCAHALVSQSANESQLSLSYNPPTQVLNGKRFHTITKDEKIKTDRNKNSVFVSEAWKVLSTALVCIIHTLCH